MRTPRTGPRRLWSITLGVIAASALALVPMGAAVAQGVTLTGGITDPGNALGGCRQQVLDAQGDLYDATGSNVFVLLVPGNGDDLDAVTDGTWESNASITAKDILFVASTGEPHARLQQGGDVDDKVTQNEQDTITEALRGPALAGDWCGATLAVISGYQTQLGGGGGGGGGIPGWLILLVVVLVVAGIALFLWNRRSASPKERALQEDMGKQASSLLLQTDDLLRSTEQEVGFAEAQFGEGQAAPYRKALDDAKGLLREAFTLSQQLDDDTPETPEQRREMLQGVIDKCTQAQQLVADQASRVKDLRDLVKNVDQVLPQTTQLVQAQTARIEGAQSTVAALSQRYQAENVQAVKGNPEAAQQKLAGATAALAAGQGSLAANDRDTAVSKVQEAETAIAEAKALLDAVDQTKTDLAKGETDLEASIAAVDQDIAQARSAIAGGKAVERSGEVERATTLLAKARQLAAATPIDLVAATRAATEANTAIDAVLAGIQEVDAAAQRNAATAQAAIANAAASVSQAQGLLNAYGATAAGRRASTRVAEASQYLSRAQSLVATDPATAAQAAQTADALADEAIAEMQASGVGGQMQWGGGGGLLDDAATAAVRRGRQRHDGQHPGRHPGWDAVGWRWRRPLEWLERRRWWLRGLRLRGFGGGSSRSSRSSGGGSRSSGGGSARAGRRSGF
ncbi:MAG: hypothetical protein U0667_07925 [Chloroflexota bacterium]